MLAVMAAGRAPGVRFVKIEEATHPIAHSIWLDGPRESAEHIGARGYDYAPYVQHGGPVAIEPHVLILYVGGRTSIQRVIEHQVERQEVGPGDLSLQSTALPTVWGWSSPIKVLHIYVSPLHLRAMARRVFADEVVAVRLHNRLRVADAEMAALGFELIGELEARLPGADIAARAVGDRILLRLLRAHAEVARVDRLRGASKDMAARLEAYVAQHLGERLDLKQLARVAGYTVPHFCRVFREAFGQAPHDYVQQQRLSLARELLLRGERGVGEIAQACGFADQSHLTRCFKRHFGVTPARFRSSAARGDA